MRLLDTALALLIDHDLAASTLAARVAASARAHPYAVVSAGLGALEGPLHGAASGLAHRMLAEVLERGGAAPVVADHLRAGRRVPGPRPPALPGRGPARHGAVRAARGRPAARRTRWRRRATWWRRPPGTPRCTPTSIWRSPSLSVAVGMPAEAGETVFAVARTAGWIAHALEEYAERPLRMRPSGQYNGPRPPQPLPLQGPSTGRPGAAASQ